MDNISQKRCTKCREWKPISEFHHNKKTTDGLSHQCKACRAKWRAEHHEEIRARSAKYYAEHREERIVHNAEHREEKQAYNIKYYIDHHEEIRVYNVARREKLRARQLAKYNMSAEDYNKMLAAQNGICAICGNPPKGKNLSIDHDHATGEVRGLLCNKCNNMLGLADESSDVLVKAIEYLSKRRLDV